MIRTQRWTNDCCANAATGDVCVFQETWDDSVDPTIRTHNFSIRERVCTLHALTDALSGFTRCKDENSRRQKTWVQLLALKSTLTIDQLIANCSYDANGLLIVNGTALGLTAQQKTNAQNFCNVNFGAGKVLVI